MSKASRVGKGVFAHRKMLNFFPAKMAHLVNLHNCGTQLRSITRALCKCWGGGSVKIFFPTLTGNVYPCPLLATNLYMADVCSRCVATIGCTRVKSSCLTVIRKELRIFLFFQSVTNAERHRSLFYLLTLWSPVSSSGYTSNIQRHTGLTCRF